MRAKNSLLQAAEDVLKAWKASPQDLASVSEAMNSLATSVRHTRKQRKAAAAAPRENAGRHRAIDRARVLVLHKQGCKHAEIARELGCSPSGIRSILVQEGVLPSSPYAK